MNGGGKTAWNIPTIVATVAAGISVVAVVYLAGVEVTEIKGKIGTLQDLTKPVSSLQKVVTGLQTTINSNVGSLEGIQQKLANLAGAVGEVADQSRVVISQIEEKADTLSIVSGPPSGAVIAFDLPGGCPGGGWTQFALGAGKVFIGVGRGVLRVRDRKDGVVSNQIELKEREYGAEGGEEKHKLTVLEMPNHQHSVGLPTYDSRSGFSGGGTGSSKWNLTEISDRNSKGTGQGKSHNNIPPYIALYFCRKD